MATRATQNFITSSNKKLLLFKDDSITKEILKKGEYDSRTLSALKVILALIQPKTSLDIGANIGNHAVVIADYTQKLYCLEPIPFIYDLLKQNLEVNTKNSKAFNLGFSEDDQTLEIGIGEGGNLGSSSIVDGDLKERVEIKVVNGDHFLESEISQEGVDFMKVDVEGYEPHVISGLKETIKKSQPLLLMEWNSNETRKGFENKRLFDEVFEDYTYYSITENTSKKLYKKSIVSQAKRLLTRTLKRKSWCLSSFDKSRNYTNVFLVPKRFGPIFEDLPFKKKR